MRREMTPKSPFRGADCSTVVHVYRNRVVSWYKKSCWYERVYRGSIVVAVTKIVIAVTEL